MLHCLLLSVQLHCSASFITSDILSNVCKRSYLLWIDWRMRSSRITTSSMAALEGAQTRILGTFLRLPCLRYCLWAYKIWMIRFTMTSDFPVPGTKLYISTLWCSVAQYALRSTPHTTRTTQLTWWSLYHTYLGFCPQASISRSQDRLFLHLVKLVLQQQDTNSGEQKVISVKCKLQAVQSCHN
jgi:hypothetical protein